MDLQTLVTVIGGVGGLIGIIGGFIGVSRSALRLQREALSKVAAVELRISTLELRHVGTSELGAAMDKLQAAIERRIDTINASFQGVSSMVQQLATDVAILNDREHGTNYAARNRRIVEEHTKRG
jgi:hypothetical protein